MTSLPEIATGAGELFALPVRGSWVVVAPLHGLSARVNREAVRALARAAAGAATCPSPLNEFLGPAPSRPPAPHSGPLSPRFLGLIPTRACNLDCGYCNFGAHSSGGGTLAPELAITAIDWMADLAAREARSTLDVHLFGGEPLLAEDLVDIVVHRTRLAAAARGLEPVLEVATNGVCSEARARFAGQYFQAIALSFDGPAEIHNLHRPFRGGAASFEHVERTARILADSAAELSLRVCVTQRNLEQLPSIADWMAGQFRPSVIDFEPLQPTPESRRAGLLPPCPYSFAHAFREAGRAASRWGVKTAYSASAREAPRHCFCPLGNDAAIVETDGSLHACYLERQQWEARGLDLRIGEASADGGMRIDEPSVARVRHLAAVRTKCEACFCRYWCTGGCRVQSSGSPESADDSFCVQTRLITIGSILDDLGAGADADALLADRPAAQRFATRPSDSIHDPEVTA